jgi:hypothetical protein
MSPVCTLRPPNTRLQRTRSAPLRSPLKRKPFGDTKRHLLRLTVTCSLLAAFGLSASSQAPNLGTRVTKPAFDGVILPAGSIHYWTPRERDILALEARLPRYVAGWLKARNVSLPIELTTYRRQYVGFVDAQGRHLIIATFFHESTDEVKSGRWLTVGMTVNGGGANYLEARYDVTARRFLEFWIDAPE